MVKKFVNEGKIEAEQEVQLYLMILEMQVWWFGLYTIKYAAIYVCDLG
jgi:hypothetical protein